MPPHILYRIFYDLEVSFFSLQEIKENHSKVRVGEGERKSVEKILCQWSTGHFFTRQLHMGKEEFS